MDKTETLHNLDEIEGELKRLNSSLVQSKVRFITGKQQQQKIRSITQRWFEIIEPSLALFGISDLVKNKYHQLFTSLLTLSMKPSWKKTFQRIIGQILSDFKDDIVVTVIKSAGHIFSTVELSKITENVTAEEKEYLNESIGCAGNGFFRGSMVLVWSAAIHRIHKVIEKLGFDAFNKKSQEMKNIHEGRFKRFRKSFNIHSLNELEATVFDTDLLWVLEYWNLIDANQHERLSICFTMRCNAAHPGEAPITDLNLASAFSDLKRIIFDNPKFKL
jgi:hypothetical protein